MEQLRTTAQMVALVGISLDVKKNLGGEKYFQCPFCKEKVTMTERMVEMHNGFDGRCDCNDIGAYEIITEDEYYAA